MKASLVILLAGAHSALAGWSVLNNVQTGSLRSTNQFFGYEDWAIDNGGPVQYLDFNDAYNAKLSSSDLNGFKTAIDTTPNQTLRRSTRLLSKGKFNMGKGKLFIIDITQMPSGCGLWPAIWLVGPNWPAGGEIDIVEGVHMTRQNAMSVHTSPGCTQGTTGFTGSFMLAGVNSNNCDAIATGAQGCGVRDARQNSFGPGFNANKGGIFATLWDATGITTWFFPRGSIPRDIAVAMLGSTSVPTPGAAAWGTPANFVASNSCNPATYFTNLQLVMNINLCGTWAGNVWNDDLSYAGQSGSCAAITGVATCNSYVLGSPQWSSNAFVVQNLKVYTNA